MTVVINHNFAATLAANNLASSNDALQRSLNRLSSGSRIVNPSDDAGGLAVSMKLSATVRRQNAVKQNIGNAVSFLQTQDGVLNVAGKVLNRISELKVLYTDPTKSSSDKANYDAEYQQLKTELTSLAAEKFNGKNLFASSTLSVGLNEDGASGSQATLGGVNLLGAGPSGSLDWQIANIGLGKLNVGMSFLNGQFVGGWGDTVTGGTIATSPDGTNWTTRLNVGGAGIYSLAYGNGVYVAGSNWGKVFYSSDAVTWHQSSYGDPSPLYVSFRNGVFTGSGGDGSTQYTSADGITWTPTAVSPIPSATNGAILLATGLNSMKWSTDGVTWHNASVPPSGGGYLKAAYGAGKFVAVSSNGGIYSSTDGDTWTSQSSPTSSPLNGLAYGGGKFVASGNGGAILESTDGVNWTLDTSGTSDQLSKVTYGNGVFVVSSQDSGNPVVSSGTVSSGAGHVGTVAYTGSLANLSLSTITDAIADVATYRAQNGGEQSRLGFADEMVTVNQSNVQAANSRITDVDVADESTKLARSNLLVQAGTAMLSQAIQSSQMVLKLLAA